MMTNRFRIDTLTTMAIFFLVIGTFLSVTVQGAYQVLFPIPLAYYLWRAKGRSFRLPASAWWLIGFSLVAILSLAINWADVPKPSKNLGRIKYFLLGAFGIFPLGVWISRVSDRTKRRLLRAAAVAVAVGGFWCAWQVLMLGVWKAKPLTETMRYSYGTALLLILWLGVFLHRRQFSWFSTPWGVLGLIGLICGVFFTQARGAQGALLLALPLVLFFWNRKLGIAAVLVGVLGMGYIVKNYVSGENTQGAIKILRSKNNESDQIRRSQWQSAFIAWTEKPILGWGFSNFHTQGKRIKYANNLAHPWYNDAHAHNVPLEIAAGTGFVGLFFFAAWFFTWAWEMWAAGGMTRALMMPFFVAILFEAQFEVILDANNATMISFLYALSLARDPRFRLPV